MADRSGAGSPVVLHAERKALGCHGIRRGGVEDLRIGEGKGQLCQTDRLSACRLCQRPCRREAHQEEGQDLADLRIAIGPCQHKRGHGGLSHSDALTIGHRGVVDRGNR